MSERRTRRSGARGGTRRSGPRRRTAGRAVAVALALVLAACSAPSPPGDHASALREEAIAREGEVSIRASLLPTAALNEAVARQYGITPDPRRLMLMVGVRRGPGHDETALPARIHAHATDLRGVRTAIAMREVRSGDFVDYVGTVQVTPPDTLRIELDVAHAAGAPSRLAFSRDVYP